jgi:hypothetical protein
MNTEAVVHHREMPLTAEKTADRSAFSRSCCARRAG